MSPLETNLASPQRGVLVEKPKFSIYTMMLVLSFLAILIGCLFLYGEMSLYDFDLWAKTAQNI